MAKYHKYVFDIEGKKFVGAFEQMYQQETKESFDSWHQEDSRQLQRHISLAIINRYNFSTIVDVGAGKGALTHLLKKQNNHVTGLDISATAISVAESRFPDIDFRVVDVNDLVMMHEFFAGVKSVRGSIDLVFVSECLSYLSNWKELIELSSQYSDYFLVSLDIPKNPIGYVKSHDELVKTVSDNFKLKEAIKLQQSGFSIVFASK